MSPKSVFVTGANRGIGLGLVKKFLEDKEIEHVFASCRNPSEATDLSALDDSRLTIIKMDVCCDESIKAAYKQIDSVVGDSGLNLLLNNAGVFVKYFTEQEPARAEIARCIDTNAIGVAIVTQIFLPLLKRASSHLSSQPASISRAAIVNISSGVASIGTNTSGSFTTGMLAYRMSKSALNSLAKTLSIDLAKDDIVVASYCPGWVQTDMGGPRAMITIDESMSQLVPSIYKLKKEDSGRYMNRSGEDIPF